MYKLVIVDDEQEVRQGIINKIVWSEFGFEIIGEAENGREALDIMEEDVPDVVITDISMPLMNGMELTAAIKETYPTVKVIILTGYDDFKFAQQAIKYGVLDYILKPVLPDDIKEMMIKLKNDIDAEIAEKEDKYKLEQHYTESLPVLRESFLTSLILINPHRADIRKKIDFFDLNILGKYFAAAVVGYDNESVKDSGGLHWDTDLLKFSILNIAQEILSKHSVGEAFFFDNTPVIIVALDRSKRTMVCNKFILIMEEIRQNVEKFLKLTVTIGLGSVLSEIDNLRESYKSALAALEYKLVLGGNKVIFVEDIEQRVTDIIAFDETKERMLVSSIKFGSKDDVALAVEALFSDVDGAKVSIREYQLYYLEIIAALSKLSRAFNLDTMDVIAEQHAGYLEVSRFETTNEVKEWLVDLCLKLMTQIASQRLNTTQVLFEKAKDYINKNYGDRELSAQKLAEYLYISTSYLGTIFKKEAGTTFLKYLISIRLEVAADQLKDPDVKIAEVAENVGYPDISYFSYFFKKNYGVSPREYRSKGDFEQ